MRGLAELPRHAVEKIRERGAQALVLRRPRLPMRRAPPLPDRPLTRDPDARHLLRNAGDDAGTRRPGRVGRGGQPGRTISACRGGGRLLGGLPTSRLLDEPSRRRLRGARGIVPLASSPARRSRPGDDRGSRDPVPSRRSCTRPTGRRSSPASCATSPAAPSADAQAGDRRTGRGSRPRWGRVLGSAASPAGSTPRSRMRSTGRSATS